ncbi:MAG: flagellar hook-basal body complex protein FliE [Oscillospiraceae bacterium]|nr:flagellar hook-basal body complex protein FliE [Oscillospiraceae bacterium]
MFIVPMSPVINTLESVNRAFEPKTEENAESTEKVNPPTFFDVFTGIFNNAVDANQQKQEDILQLMMGDTDNLEEIQANIAKAEIATELLVNVKNAVVDAYKEIIQMNI